MKAIIFDLDGTLWDTSDVVVDIWNKVLRSQCKDLVMTKGIMASLMGKNQAQFVDEFFVGVEKSEADRVIKQIFLNEQEYLIKHGANMYEGVLDTLNMLKNDYALMIVSNCQSGYLDAFLTHYNLKDVITDFECAGATGLSKGENIRLVLERNNVQKAIFVGDTKSDEIAAKDASLPFVYALYGFGDAHNFERKIDKFTDIIKVAQKLL